VITSGAINGVEAQTQTGITSNGITITGTTSGEIIRINEENTGSEICTFAGVVVRGSGVKSLGPTSLCPDSERYGWDISPNPGGKDTIYKVIGNGFSAGGLQEDIIRELTDGAAKDNDVYFLDANQFSMFDGAWNDAYKLVGDSSVNDGRSIPYSDSEGDDKMTFVERGQ
jgi:hypothetical protein